MPGGHKETRARAWTLTGRLLLPRARRARRGMTLIEVLIASSILVFGMVGVISIIAAGSRSHKRAVDETIATQVGASVMAELRGLFARGYQPPPLPVTKAREHDDYPGYRYAVILTDIKPRLAKLDSPLIGREFYVEVHVLWGPKDEPKVVIFRTVMFLRPRGLSR